MRWLGTATVAALVSGAVCLLVHYFGVFPVRAVDVPVLRGLSQAQGREMLATRDLLLVLDGETPDPLPPGTIAQQRPLAGSQLPHGSTVYAQLAVPLPLSAGAQGTSSAGAQGTRAPPPAPAPMAPPPVVPPPVAAPPPPISPVVTTPVAPSDPLAVTPKNAPPHAAPPSVSPHFSPIPSLVGKRMPQAREIVQRAGFSVGNVRMGSDNDVGPDRVLRQQPIAGTPAAPGTAIDLVVNEGE